MSTKFEKIILQAILDAEAVKVPFGDFVAGLREMRDEVNERLALAEDELESQNEDE